MHRVGPTNSVLLSPSPQVELRILAHFSRDEVLLAAFRSGGDVFRYIAAQIALLSRQSSDAGGGTRQRWHQPLPATLRRHNQQQRQVVPPAVLAAVTDRQRKEAKEVCYSILYGSGDAVRVCTGLT